MRFLYEPWFVLQSSGNQEFFVLTFCHWGVDFMSPMDINLPPRKMSFFCAYCDHYMLIAAMNPCPCGYYGDPVKPCTCSAGMVTKYQKRISGPLLDRIDIHTQVPRVEYEKLSDARLGEPSSILRQRVESARVLQRARFKGTDMACNSDMRPAEVRKFCALDNPGSALMKTAMNQLQLSARAYHRVLKLARTIADLAGCETIAPHHLAEALQYLSLIHISEPTRLGMISYA